MMKMPSLKLAVPGGEKEVLLHTCCAPCSSAIVECMLKQGIEKVKQAGFRGMIVEGNFRFYNTVGFRTSAEYGIYPVSGYPMTEPRCQMAMETFPGSLKDRGGYVVYDMYYNA